MFKIHVCTPYESAVGEIPDIAKWLEYDFYLPVWLFGLAQFPVGRQLLGKDGLEWLLYLV